MEMRVVVPDATMVLALAEQLSVALGSDRISIPRDRPRWRLGSSSARIGEFFAC